jgi:hypothetical protein
LHDLLPALQHTQRHNLRGSGACSCNQNCIASRTAQARHVGRIDARYATPDLKAFDDHKLQGAWLLARALCWQQTILGITWLRREFTRCLSITYRLHTAAPARLLHISTSLSLVIKN